MEIKDVKNLRKALAENIESLISDFESETEITVEGLKIRRVDAATPENLKKNLIVCIEVELEL